jgi:hypothetical protein
MAQLTGYFLLHKNDADAAIEHIAEWLHGLNIPTDVSVTLEPSALSTMPLHAHTTTTTTNATSPAKATVDVQ